MDPFVRQLVERLHEAGAPMSRNKHFHAFDNPLGRQALTISKRLRAFAQVLAKLSRDGGAAKARRVDGAIEIELALPAVKGRRVTRFEPEELELLCAMPGARDALDLTAL
ncbi:MAG: hypothetical protein K1X89_18910 [Myxococcaceae bacterium]|nr:hypothetical protein [Myxococcaceae bacterium]